MVGCCRYDSWWYEKGSEAHTAYDPANGMVNWTDAWPVIFPSGLRYMYQQTGVIQKKKKDEKKTKRF